MVEDEPYDLMPHREIEELKRQVKELKTRSDKSSSKEIVNSLERLTKSMDAMLKLFTEAAKDVKSEEREESKIGHKLDAIIDQNKTIAKGMVAVSDMVKNFVEKQGHGPASAPRPAPRPGFQPLQPPQPPEPDFQQPPPFAPQPNEPRSQGPVAMPTMPFPGLEAKPKKKGLFGRLKK
ncbi:hypothetical protein CMO93_02335 [Candidatus Woesearchaeota archaeon]|nr:hypothetical protein [Candidatus Woesearchaeota archaeon]|tara:strand:- start:10394 stop:10927 length:534 start_codon:yes stop_codon:yes gene_type:complete